MRTNPDKITVGVFRCSTSGNARQRVPRASQGAQGTGGVPVRCPGRGQASGRVWGAQGAARCCRPIGREELSERLGQLSALDTAVSVDDELPKEALVDLPLDEVGCGFVVPVAVAGHG